MRAHADGSDPGPISGTFTTSAANIHLTQPVNGTFPFSDPSSGATGTITIVGTIQAGAGAATVLVVHPVFGQTTDRVALTFTK